MKLRFKTKPWKHQMKALKYLGNKKFAALYTDMGTGKTKVMIDLINNKNFKRVLIVCPKKAMDVWKSEFDKHSYDTTICVLNTKDFDVKRKCTEVKNLLSGGNLGSNKGVIIINYDSVWREPLKKELLKTKFDAVMCDESHRIKSPSSKCSGFLTQIGKRTPHRYLITGTPLAQSPLDIYAQYRFLDPTIFGTRYDDFKHRYANFVYGQNFLDKKEPFKNLDELHEKMFSCAFLATSDLELPPTQDILIDFDLPSKTQKYYTEFQKESCLIFKDGSVVAENVLSSILRLQQLCSGYLPIDTAEKIKKIEEIDRARINTLKELMEDFDPEEPLVIFCKYRIDINNIHELCKELKITASEVSGKADNLAEWQSGKTKVLIAQIKSGSESIDLTRARYCIYYSLDFSLSAWKQSRKRVHRPNQTRSVVYYILVAKHKKCKTIDEKILESLQNNENIIESIMEAREI